MYSTEYIIVTARNVEPLQPYLNAIQNPVKLSKNTVTSSPLKKGIPKF